MIVLRREVVEAILDGTFTCEEFCSPRSEAEFEKVMLDAMLAPIEEDR